MCEFTNDEQIVLLLYGGDSREDTVANLNRLKKQLQPEDAELMCMTDHVLSKLESVSSADYSMLLEQMDRLLLK